MIFSNSDVDYTVSLKPLILKVVQDKKLFLSKVGNGNDGANIFLK